MMAAWGGGQGTQPDKTPEQRGCISAPLSSLLGGAGADRLHDRCELE